MEGITSLGAGSGLDLAGLVDQLVGAERQSRQGRLDLSQARTQSQLSAFGQIQGAVSSFKDTLEPLEDLESFRGRTAVSGDEEAFTVTADSKAATGQYAVEIVALAQSQKLRTDAYESSSESVGTGNITIASGDESFTVAIEEGLSSLADIRDAINASSDNTSITAGIVNSVDGAHLVLTGSEPGKSNAFTVSVAEGDGGLASLAYAGDESPSGFTEVDAAADALLRVDGLEISSGSNTVTDAIEGVSINLLAAEEGKTLNLDVGFDRDAAKQAIQTFVQGYNNVLLTVGNQTSFNPETFQSGPLFGDSAVRSLVSEVRELVTRLDPDQSASLRSLAQIGIATELDGSLSIDEELLDSAMDTNFEEVGAMFAGEEGLSASVGSLLGSYLEPTGRLTTRTETLESRIDDFGDQREVLERSMESFESRIRRQFTALDGLISELNNTSTFLAQQLESLPGSGAN